MSLRIPSSPHPDLRMTANPRRRFLQGLSATSVLALAPRLSAASTSLPTLRKLAGGQPLIGVAVPTHFEKDLSPEEISLLTNQFDSITPENGMKWPSLSPTENENHFEPLDQIFDFAAKNQQKIVGHTLIFNRAENYPLWIFQDGGKEASATLVWKRVESHIETLMTRYKGRVDSWDVLNEFVEAPAPGYRVTDLTRVLGPDYPVRLFKLAAEIDPKAKLTYNDFSVESPDRLKAILAFVRSLRDQGCRVDIMGSQSHLVLNDKSADEIDTMIKKFAAEGIRCALTEMDVDVIPRNAPKKPQTAGEADPQNPYLDRCPAEVLEHQAKIYGDVFAAVLANRKHVARVTFWGMTDRHSWLNDWPWKRVNHGLLFDREAKPKPAFYAVAKALAGI